MQKKRNTIQKTVSLAYSYSLKCDIFLRYWHGTVTIVDICDVKCANGAVSMTRYHEL